jgi:hypothetical protein
MQPAFLITIDTEGDDLWSSPDVITARNAEYLPRFQQLCERHGLKPTYLTNYEMAIAAPFQALARDALARGTAEVGMHLHAWNSPPLQVLTDNDMQHQPYLIEYPDAVMRQKIEFMTRLLEDTFNMPMRSHRAGRWAVDSRYLKLLVEYGYTVDCSVTPTVSWARSAGAPAGHGGADYRDYPAEAYYMDLDAPGRVGDSGLLQLPMTVRWPGAKLARWLPSSLRTLPVIRRVAERRQWMRPTAGNISELLHLLQQEITAGSPYIEFMLHSSEFMPAGSRVFASEQSIEQLYEELEQLFGAVARNCCGRTLSEYAAEVAAGVRPAARCSDGAAVHAAA